MEEHEEARTKKKKEKNDREIEKVKRPLHNKLGDYLARYVLCFVFVCLFVFRFLQINSQPCGTSLTPRSACGQVARRLAERRGDNTVYLPGNQITGA